MQARVITILLQSTIPCIVGDWSIARFGRLAALLRGERDPNGLPVFEVTTRDRDAIGKLDSVLGESVAFDLAYALSRGGTLPEPLYLVGLYALVSTTLNGLTSQYPRAIAITNGTLCRLGEIRALGPSFGVL